MKSVHVHFSVFSNDGSEFGGSYYQKVNDELECGVNLSWTAGTNATRFGLAAKYQPDRDSTFRAKINNASQIGFGYQQKLRDGKMIFISSFNISPVKDTNKREKSALSSLADLEFLSSRIYQSISDGS